ncbi:MAG: HAMP domain-containing sensor histidine kinase [Pseudomonadota bacterium]
MLEGDRITPEIPDLGKELQAEEPLSSLAACIASSLAVEHCAIEYTTASGDHRWVAPAHDTFIRRALLRFSNHADQLVGEPMSEVPLERLPNDAAERNGLGKLRFLVNTPLTLKSGTLIGRLWLGDSKPKALAHDLTDRLEDFVRVASEMIYQQSSRSRLISAQAMSGTGSWTWRASNGRFFGSLQFWQCLSIGESQDGVSPSIILRRLKIEYRRKVIAAFKNAIETRSSCSMELQINDNCGNIKHVAANMRIDIDLNGELVGAFGTLQDITDHKRVEELGDQNKSLEEALRAANELADQHRSFVSMVCHEFRTPLAIIDGKARRVERELSDNEALEAAYTATGRIRSAVKRLTGVIERFLSATRFEAGRMSLAPEWLDLVELLNDISTTQLEIASSRRIELDFDGSETMIFGDGKLLHHVFTNLMSNALKYSPKSESIWVSTRQENGAVTVSVRDEGVGIPEDELDKVYDRFFRASTSAGIIGTGYGLHIVKEFVELHGGSIHLTSQKGQGSTFTVRLPVKPPAANGPATP